MSDSESLDSRISNHPEEKVEERYPRPVGSPLPIGIRGITPWAEVDNDPHPLMPGPPFKAAPPAALAQPPVNAAPPAQPALPAPSASQVDSPSTLQRAVNLFRIAMPYVQRVLPLLDGNVGTAVSNMLVPRPHPTPPPLTPDLSSIHNGIAGLQNGLTEVQAQNRELRSQVVEQSTALRKIDDQLQQVREATDRNTLEQQELLWDLKRVGEKVNLFAYFALSLLGLSVILNVVLFLHIWRIIP